MGSDPSIRASDRDRDRTAQLLSAHHSAGRLDAEEFAERLDLVYVAKTIDDLDELTADLPAIDLYPLPSASMPRARPGWQCAACVVGARRRAGWVRAGLARTSRRGWPGSGRAAGGALGVLVADHVRVPGSLGGERQSLAAAMGRDRRGGYRRAASGSASARARRQHPAAARRRPVSVDRGRGRRGLTRP